MTTKYIHKLNELNNLLENNNRYYIYGAGRFCYALFSYITESIGSLDGVVSIIVSDKKYNPDSVMGIEIISYDEAIVDDRDIVIVTVFEKSHEAIKEILGECEAMKVFLMDGIYGELRGLRANFDIDILNNTQWTRDDLRRTDSKLCKRIESLSRRIDDIQKKNERLLEIHYRNINSQHRIEQCIRWGTRYYEETLTELQYPSELKRWYREAVGKELNLDSPQSFNEKIQWIKLYGITPVIEKLVDKYEVRNWVREKIGDEYLIPLLGVYDSFDEIDFDKLPDRFVLKCTHGCGFNNIVKNKEDIDMPNLKRLFDRWLDFNYAYHGGMELQYKNLHSRIIVEKYLQNEENDLFDYKFWCFNGRCEFIMFLSERATGLKMDNFDRNWNHLEFTYDYPNSEKEIRRPENLEEMIIIAEKLAEGFPFVRVDLYRLNNGIIKFGEMTFTPASGICKWNDEDVDVRLGKLIKLPIDKDNEIKSLQE